MKSVKRKPHSLSLVLLVVCIFVVWWGIGLLVQSTPAKAPAIVPQVQPQMQPLVVHETIQGITYSYSGVFTPASACDSFGSGIRYRSTNGGHISILLVTQPSLLPCAQAADTTNGEPFTVSVVVHTKGAPMFDGVLLNGSSIPAQLVEEK